MKLNQVPLSELECAAGVVRASTPFILEYSEAAALAADLFSVYRELVNPAASRLGPRRREANAESYEFFAGESPVGRLHVVYDIEETRLALELAETDARKCYRLLREQRLVRPDLELVRRSMAGSLAETVAALFWQVGAIKVSLGDLRPLFKVDEGRNFSPIYIDVKGLSAYPAVNDFVLSAAALLLRNVEFDAICGIESGSISIAALLAQKLARPMFYARRTRRFPEAAVFEGIKSHELFRKRVLLVDDTLVHGWTKARVIAELRAQEARVDTCFVIFDRQQQGSADLARAGVRLLSLTDRTAGLSERIPREISLLTDEEFVEVNDYFRDPAAWHRRRGLVFHDVSARPPGSAA